MVGNGALPSTDELQARGHFVDSPSDIVLLPDKNKDGDSDLADQMYKPRGVVQDTRIHLTMKYLRKLSMEASL